MSFFGLIGMALILQGTPLTATAAGALPLLFIAHQLTGEFFCSRICDMMADATQAVMESAKNITKGDLSAYENLTYGLLLSGLAMQMMGNSRPASGAEHHISHFIEMAPEGLEATSDALHGEKVGVAAAMVADHCHEILALDPLLLDTKAYKALPVDRIRKIFGSVRIFSAPNGNCIDRSILLEQIIRFCVPESPEASIPTREEITARVEEVSQEYIRKICPEHLIDNKRMQHLYSKLRRLSCLLIDNVMGEFEDGDFRPAFFELRINGENGNPSPMVLPLKNGAQLVLRGFIDRVDLWRDGNDVYVRIVDYKTGKKEFSLDNVREGLDTQMLLYLLCICADPGTKLKNMEGIDADGKILPAGITYLSSALPKIEVKNFDVSEDDILALTEKKLSRSGILLDEEKILDAVSHSSSKELLLGITKNKEGKLEGKALISPEDFDTLGNDIKKTLVDIAHNIYDGIADCEPKSSDGVDPCKYCTARPVCRRIEQKGGNNNGN